MTDRRTDTLSRRLLEKIKSLTNEIEKLHLDVRDADERNKLIDELVNAITNDALTRSRDAELLALMAYVAARASHLSVCNKDDKNCIQLAEKADAAAKAVYDFSVKTTKFDLEKQKMDEIRHYACTSRTTETTKK
jgi:hypothetical protein